MLPLPGDHHIGGLRSCGMLDGSSCHFGCRRFATTCRSHLEDRDERLNLVYVTSHYDEGPNYTAAKACNIAA